VWRDEELPEINQLFQQPVMFIFRSPVPVDDRLVERTHKDVTFQEAVFPELGDPPTE
jgi:hypothetical protein